jgi:hypothetical protein
VSPSLRRGSQDMNSWSTTQTLYMYYNHCTHTQYTFYPYKHFRRTEIRPTNLEIDEVSIDTSLRDMSSITKRVTPLNSKKIRALTSSQGLKSRWTRFNINNPTSWASSIHITIVFNMTQTIWHEASLFDWLGRMLMHQSKHSSLSSLQLEFVITSSTCS